MRRALKSKLGRYRRRSTRKGKWDKHLRTSKPDDLYKTWHDLMFIRRVLYGPACFIPRIDILFPPSRLAK